MTARKVALATLTLALASTLLGSPAAALPGAGFKATLQQHRGNPQVRGLHRAGRDPHLYEYVKYGSAYDLRFEVFTYDGRQTHMESLGITTSLSDKSLALLPSSAGGLALIASVFGAGVAEDYRHAIMFKETDRTFYQGSGSPDNLFVKQRFIGRKYAYYLQLDEGVNRRDLDGDGPSFKAFARKTRRGAKFLNWYSLSVEPFDDAVTKYPWLLDKYPQLLTPAERAARRLSGSR